MKTKIILLFGAIGLLTLSFTFTTTDNKKPSTSAMHESNKAADSAPVGGLFAVDVIE